MNAIRLPQHYNSKLLATLLILVMSWVLFPLLFFSLSKSKLPGYILPVFPPLALFVVVSLRSVAPSKKFQWAGLAIGLILALGGVLIPPCIRSLDLESSYGLPHSAVAGTCIAVLAGLCAIVLAFRRKSKSSLLVAQVAVVMLAIQLPGGALAAILDAKYSTRTVVKNYQGLQFEGTAWKRAAQEPFTYSVPRAYQYSLNFYFHRELPAWPELSTQEAVVFVAQPFKRLPYSTLRCMPWESAFAIVPCRTASLLESVPRDSSSRRKPD